MKALDTPELSHLAEILEYSSPECKVHTRFGPSTTPASLPIQPSNQTAMLHFLLSRN